SGARAQLGSQAYSLLPSLCWFNASDAFLHLLCGIGSLLSILLVLGFAPILCLILLFICYLSLAVAGQDFLSFQWDILLLETGFLAIFFAPAEFWLSARCKKPVSGAGLFLLKLLLFKLMFMSGVVKLTSHDESWWNLSALDYHYWSQPLPTVFAWWADKHPEWFKEFSVGFCLVVEIIVPFFIWTPRRLRLMAAGLLIALQIAIALTGNYCFFNLLTITLCLLLIDDASLPRRRWHRVKMEGPALAGPSTPASQESRSPMHWISATARSLPVAVVIIVTLPLNAWQIFSAVKPEAECPTAISRLNELVERFRIVNGYGLFRVMTKDRREIVIEGSADGMNWRAYEFKWKPGDLTRTPGWCAPHQPRLDWQMWFAALSSVQQNRWFLQLIGCLLENKKAVTRLLANNPFPQNGPRYIRGRFYRYRFTSTPERRQTGAWWRREELGEYLPTVSLR
ncbi:MAG: hypothetical protein JWO45_10, partial [Spartobacteria bacterium]|nr:hypothetical protein [Spartobacteria bacterium]